MSDGLEPSLARFYAELAPLLFSEASVAQIEDRLGPSASGADNLDFYRELVGRNTSKILGELFSPVRALCDRLHPGLWSQLLVEYGRSHRGDARDPNWFGEHFSTFLATRREQGAEQSPLLEELADYVFCRFVASTAADEFSGDDPVGFEQRLFVRLYTAAIPELLAALRKDPEDAAIPEGQPSTVLIFRHWRERSGHGVRWHRPDLAQLAALARRQGLALPPAMAALGENAIDQGLATLVRIGVLG
ncbi:MAG: putative DNA-binding domain-containing protein [Myxococcales bacterium]|nr:putative DNA-binding domain-containing protein [Myxococcales bacterium]